MPTALSSGLFVLLLAGCAGSRHSIVDDHVRPFPRTESSRPFATTVFESFAEHDSLPGPIDAPSDSVQAVAEIERLSTDPIQESGANGLFSAGLIQVAAELAPVAESPSGGDSTVHPLLLDDVVAAVYRSYPALQAALFSRNIALGEQLAANGAFDLTLAANSDNGPTGFYQTYRQNVSLVQPTYWGGEVFAGYRIGRGDYQPWYLERQTNDGGEFRAGIEVPLARDYEIDSRRAALWRAGWQRQLVEPDIQAQLIGFVQEAGYAYWEWVSAGEQYRLAERVLAYATDRTERIRDQVDEGLIDPPELTDNLRLVAERRAKLAEAARKLEQASIKLSLYWRDVNGRPVIPDESWLPAFPEPELVDRLQLPIDIQHALTYRPEIQVLDFTRRQLEIDYAAAQNQMRPEFDAVLWGSQDVGAPTSPKRDKSEFELEAALLFELPLQRRQARGKVEMARGKLAQLSAKRRLTEDKIVIDVEVAYAALATAFEQVFQAREAVRLADELAERERINQEEGLSDLLKVTLREQYAAEAATKEIDALLQYYRARTDYRAALGQDHPNRPVFEPRPVPPAAPTGPNLDGSDVE